MERLSVLMQGLTDDPWRAAAPFSPEIQGALEMTLDPSANENEIKRVLSGWISKHQPCLFGRIAAKQDLLVYCLLTEEDLMGPDEALEEKIQSSRLEWTRLGFEGKASGFIIAVLSQRIALALPNEVVQLLARRICSLYLQEEVEPDRIYVDRTYLEAPGRRRRSWEWLAGVNYFSAQADGRWWHDHRFPAGIAFSVNSVGHMVKSGKLTRAMDDFEKAVGVPLEDLANPKVDSLDKALELAMRTIDMAQTGPSGKATNLTPRSPTNDRPVCPKTLPAALAAWDCRKYQGYYHTDYTIPSEYFTSDVERPTGLQSRELDFTYLFDKSLDNPDHVRMGEGRPIRDASEQGEDDLNEKRLKANPIELDINQIPRLLYALAK
jgi:hypothetical protein